MNPKLRLAQAKAEQEVGFLRTLRQSLHTPGLVEQFNRLTGRKLGQRSPKTQLDAMIDKATGFDVVRESENMDDMKAFAEFVRDVVWTRLPPHVRREMSKTDFSLDVVPRSL